jgi:hypothetical protein
MALRRARELDVDRPRARRAARSPSQSRSVSPDTPVTVSVARSPCSSRLPLSPRRAVAALRPSIACSFETTVALPSALASAARPLHVLQLGLELVELGRGLAHGAPGRRDQQHPGRETRPAPEADAQREALARRHAAPQGDGLVAQAGEWRRQPPPWLLLMKRSRVRGA